MRERARRRALKREMVRDAEKVRRQLAELVAELDEPMPGAEHAVVIEGRIIGDEIVTE
jgi:hypothetical protein